jgi:transposase
VQKADLTLEELRRAVGLKCSLPAIHYTLAAMGLTYKKRRSALLNKNVQTLSKRGGSGCATKSAWTRPNSCSLTNQRPKRT